MKLSESPEAWLIESHGKVYVQRKFEQNATDNPMSYQEELICDMSGYILALERRVADAAEQEDFIRDMVGDPEEPKPLYDTVAAYVEFILQEAEANTQRAVDGVLREAAASLGSLYMHRDGHDLYNKAIDDCAAMIVENVGENPLATLQAELAAARERIAELEGIYNSAVKGRQDMRSAVREDRERIAALERDLEAARKDAHAKQAKIDALMFEHCPDEMTEEQRHEYELAQAAFEGDEAAIDAAMQEDKG